MTENIDKLPKWAQSRIRVAENRAEWATKRLLEALGESDEASDTQIYMGHNEKPVGLPNRTPIRFQTERGVIEVRVEGGRLDIHSSVGPLAIRPIVTNSIEIEVIPR